jgi:3-dehydroquinate dehydratase/shikimate dehydrogenase
VTLTDAGPSSLCATVGGATTADLRRARDEAAAAGADLVEVRLDSAADPDPAGALEGRRGRILVTCRPAWEGGTFRGSEEARLALLERAWTLGAEFVDVESRAPGTPGFLARTRGERVVLSEHHFDAVPRDLDARLAALCASSASVVKIAVAASRLRDTLPLFAWGRAHRDRRVVALAMGMAGLPTRVLAAHAGSCWTYAGEGWAPGQVPAERLLREFRYRRVTATTAIYAVLGRPIGHSLSPALHNAAFDVHGDDAVYVPLEAEDVDDFLGFAAALRVAGVSVTAPFKVALAPYARLDEAATTVGALNTLRRDGSTWTATNTDVEGFLAPLDGRLPLVHARAAVLGTGGAARAVAFALGRRGAHVTVHGRNLQRAAEVAALGAGQGAAWTVPSGSWDLLVNATPIGTAPRDQETPLPGACFDGTLVYDLVYNPPSTRLLAEAAAAGCDTLGGLDMLVAQAQAQQLFWLGRRPDAAPMRAAASRRLEADAPSPSGPRPGATAR